MQFGKHIRAIRLEHLEAGDKSYTLRQVARRVGVQPAYISQVERDQGSLPSETTIQRWAADLGEDPDVMLAMAGKVSSDLQAIICKRPQLFADLLRQLKQVPDRAVLRIVREVRDGEW